jgi:ribosomal protein L11 methyltransferase
MKVFLEISIRVDPSERELLWVPLLELGLEAFQETDDCLLGYVEASRWRDEKRSAVRELLTRVLGPQAPEPVYRSIRENNWNQDWENSIRPIEIGDRFLIAPSWCKLESEAHGRLVLRIDPKMSFGTGYHESTRLMLRLLERYVLAGSVILDVGTGTGILAIAAVKLGASEALGLEIDPWAIENARENVALNGLSGKVRISDERVSELPPSCVDLVAANLTLNTILQFLKNFHSALSTEGTLLVSGLLKPDREQMEHALIDHGFRILEVLPENEWIAVAAGKLS